MIWVLLQSESPWQRNDVITFGVAGDDPNKQTRNETSRGVSQQVRLGTVLRVGKNKKTTENQKWRLTVI